MLVLSPTPPVECLSTRGAEPQRGNTTPLSRIARVSVAVSLRVMPFSRIAIKNAPSCASCSD